MVAALAGVRPPKKYRNRPTGGYASTKEARRAQELKLLLDADQIRNLREQVSYVLIPAQRDENGKLLEHQCRYVADFVYDEWVHEWIERVEDCKGMRTDEYVIKRKLMLKVHGIRIRET